MLGASLRCGGHLRSFPLQVYKMHRSAIMSVERAAKEYSRCLAYKNLGDAISVVTASSGMAAVALLSNLCRNITVYGMGQARVNVSLQVGTRSEKRHSRRRRAGLCEEGGLRCAAPASNGARPLRSRRADGAASEADSSSVVARVLPCPSVRSLS